MSQWQEGEAWQRYAEASAAYDAADAAQKATSAEWHAARDAYSWGRAADPAAATERLQAAMAADNAAIRATSELYKAKEAAKAAWLDSLLGPRPPVIMRRTPDGGLEVRLRS